MNYIRIAGLVVTMITCPFMAQASVVVGTTTQPELWFNSQVGVLTSDGSSVTTWQDQSGNGRHATVPAGGSGSPTLVNNVQIGMTLRETYPVVSFDGGNDALSGIGMSLAGFEAFIVARLQTGVSANEGVLTFGTASGWDYQSGGAIPWSSGYDYDDGSATGGGMAYNGVNSTTFASVNLPLDQFYLYNSSIIEGASSSIQDGTLKTVTTADGYESTTRLDYQQTGSYTSISPTYFTIGARSSGGGAVGGYAPVQIAEIILYSGALSTDERAAVMNYLDAKYVAIPEPGTFAMMLLGAGLILWARHLRGRKR